MRPYIMPELIGCHELDGLARQKPLAVQSPAIEEHLREAHIVEGGRHRAAAAAVKLNGLPGGMWNALRLAGHGIVGKGERVTCLLGLRNREAGIDHVERFPNALGEEGGERLAGHSLD